MSRLAQPNAVVLPGSRPDFEALVAGTVALMTAWARREREAAPACAAMCAKLLANLTLLAEHPAASEPLRRVMANAHRHWLELVPDHAAALCHATPVSAALH